jgi:putative flippase GtrA
MKRTPHLFLLARHFITSSISAMVEFSIFYLMYLNLNISLINSHATAFFFATISGFIMHSYFTFSIGHLSKRNAFFFVIQALAVLVSGFYLLDSLIKHNFHPLISKVLQLFSTFFLNVLLGKFFTFKR